MYLLFNKFVHQNIVLCSKFFVLRRKKEQPFIFEILLLDSKLM